MVISNCGLGLTSIGKSYVADPQSRVTARCNMKDPGVLPILSVTCPPEEEPLIDVPEGAPTSDQAKIFPHASMVEYSSVVFSQTYELPKICAGRPADTALASKAGNP